MGLGSQSSHKAVIDHEGRKLLYECDFCEKSFITPSKLKRHSFTHSNLQPYQCDLCPKSYNQPGNLKVHITNIHQVIQEHRSDKSINISQEKNQFVAEC